MPAAATLLEPCRVAAVGVAAFCSSVLFQDDPGHIILCKGSCLRRISSHRAIHLIGREALGIFEGRVPTWLSDSLTLEGGGCQGVPALLFSLSFGGRGGELRAVGYWVSSMPTPVLFHRKLLECLYSLFLC